MSLSREIVRQFTAVKAGPMPDAVLASARVHCLDALGVGLVAGSMEQGQPYRRFAVPADGSISLLTGGGSSNPADAALVNGGLIHSLEFDDTHTASIVHGSAVLVPAALAMAQARGRNLEDMLRAYVCAYEVLIRIGLASAGGFQRNGFQVTSVGGTLVAALVAADMLDMDETGKVYAIGIALSQASGVFEFLTNGSSVKSLHPGWAAHAGITAARLATSSLTGPETAIEGRNGLFAAFARDQMASERLHGLLQDMGSRWHFPDTAFKFLPCCHYLHPFVEAAGIIAGKIGDPADIEKLILRIAPGAAPIVCEPWEIKANPVDGHSARWSLPVVTAARLVEGKVGLDTFETKASAEVLALASRSRWEALEPNRFPQAFEAQIVCHLADGRMLTAHVADVFGNASRPATDENVMQKFRDNAGRCLQQDAVAAIEALFLGPGSAGFGVISEALMSCKRQE